MLLFQYVSALQVFSLAEFDFCYNYIFYEPFQEHLKIIQSEVFTFDDQFHRELCDRTENIIFRQVNHSFVSFTLQMSVDLNEQPFSVFFFQFTNVTLFNAKIELKMLNSGSDVSVLVSTAPEYSLKVIQCEFKIGGVERGNFYGIANNLTELLVVNRSSFEFNVEQGDSVFVQHPLTCQNFQHVKNLIKQLKISLIFL
ncbi:Hypothetical_protein [Hexamita inflata]|uniref:Hypothetical_protein n=1 Tax=Hexamita inflata TaxID=28002 RepID=A0AA86PF37_9EUKA|nr:Hypothetical protein HINF_LOCUS25820 [Hexamita inflata]